MNIISVDMPVMYSVTIQEPINSDLKQILGEADVTIIKKDTLEKTFLQILVKDQAHLNGILNRLFERKCVILQVKCTPLNMLKNAGIQTTKEGILRN